MKVYFLHAPEWDYKVGGVMVREDNSSFSFLVHGARIGPRIKDCVLRSFLRDDNPPLQIVRSGAYFPALTQPSAASYLVNRRLRDVFEDAPNTRLEKVEFARLMHIPIPKSQDLGFGMVPWGEEPVWIPDLPHDPRYDHLKDEYRELIAPLMREIFPGFRRLPRETQNDMLMSPEALRTGLVTRVFSEAILEEYPVINMRGDLVLRGDYFARVRWLVDWNIWRWFEFEIPREKAELHWIFGLQPAHMEDSGGAPSSSATAKKTRRAKPAVRPLIDRIRREVRKRKLEKWEDEILAAARPAIRVRYEAVKPGLLAAAASRAGGYPAVWDGLEWPRNADSSPAIFLMQVNLADIAPHDEDHWLPSAGLLLVFKRMVRRNLPYESPELVTRFLPGEAIDRLADGSEEELTERLGSLPRKHTECRHSYEPVWSLAPFGSMHAPPGLQALVDDGEEEPGGLFENPKSPILRYERLKERLIGLGPDEEEEPLSDETLILSHPYHLQHCVHWQFNTALGYNGEDRRASLCVLQIGSQDPPGFDFPGGGTMYLGADASRRPIDLGSTRLVSVLDME